MSVPSCQQKHKQQIIETEKPEYFLLRPEIEKAFGYSHTIKIGNDIKISGAVSIDDEGNPTAIGDLETQMKNCYADLEKMLKHYDCTFGDVVVEKNLKQICHYFLKIQPIEVKFILTNFLLVLDLESKNWHYQV
jgi:hypothetical protein